MAAKKKVAVAAPARERDAAREAELLAAVLAAPADDTPRLVYADWLLEHDDPRGEFIQLQLKLGTPRNASGAQRYIDVPVVPTVEHEVEGREALEKREVGLMKKHQTTWAAPIKPYVFQVLWRRGFIDYVEAKGGVFLDGAEQVFASTPLVHAVLTSFDKTTLPKLLTAGGIRRLPSLSLKDQRIGPKESGALASSHFSGLRYLDLQRNPLGNEGAIVLASNPHFTSLQTLSLYGCGVGRAGLEAISKAAWFPDLRSLSLAVFLTEPHETIGPAAAELVARGRALRYIDLLGLHLGDEGAQIIGASDLPELTEIALDDVTAVGLLALARSKTLPKLCRLQWRLRDGNEGPNVGAVVDALPELRARFGENFGRRLVR